MTTLILIEKFNKAYSQFQWVDYYAINSITDTQVKLMIYTKFKISPKSRYFDDLTICNLNLGEELNREIVWDYCASKHSLISKFTCWLKRN